MRRRHHNPRPAEFQDADGSRTFIRVCTRHLSESQQEVELNERLEMVCPVSGHIVRDFVVLEAEPCRILASVQPGRFWVNDNW
jgi:hypothetical protein